MELLPGKRGPLDRRTRATNKLGAVFTDMLPGATKSATLRYENTGRNAQDVWVDFKGAGVLGLLTSIVALMLSWSLFFGKPVEA